MLADVRKQVSDLMAYFPGRGRIARLWLVVLPIGVIIAVQILFGGILRIRWEQQGSSELLAAQMFSAMFLTSLSLLWMLMLGTGLALVRVCGSENRAWPATVSLAASSILYAMIVSIPMSLVTTVWAAFFLGTFPSIPYLVAGFVLWVGALLLVVGVLVCIAHHVRLLIPPMLALTWVYSYVAPFRYPDTMLQKWILALPLSPQITILRNGAFDSGPASSWTWIAASIHAALGYALAYVCWKSAAGGEKRT